MSLKTEIVEKLQQCESIYWYTNSRKSFEETWTKEDKEEMLEHAHNTIKELEWVLQFILNKLDNETNLWTPEASIS